MKRKFLVLMFFLSFLLTSCNLLLPATERIYKEADVQEVNNSVSDVVKSVEKACIGVFAKSSVTSSSGSIGSGVVVLKKNGRCYAITNSHVVDGHSQFRAYVDENKFVSAKLEALLPMKDLALISFDDQADLEIKSLDISNKKEIIVTPGERVIAIGCPLGLEHFNSVTVGYASKYAYDFDTDNYQGKSTTINVIQHDAPINSGNSGGALFNMNGDLIGINFQKITTSSSGVAVEGFSYSISMAEVLIFMANQRLIEA